MSNLSVILKLCRETRKLSLEEVKDLTGISRSTICRMETGICTNPSFKHVKALAECYKISLDDLK